MGKYRGSDFVYRRVKKKIDGRYIILAILILMMIVLGGTFLFLKENRKVSFVENVFKSTGTFTLKVVSYPINFFNDTIKREREKNRIYDTYHSMQEKYDSINTLASELKEAKKEVADLEGLLNLNSTFSENSYVNATVLSRNVGYWYDDIILDKGSSDSISEFSAVVNQDGLIGYITSVAKRSSTVKLLTNSNINKISIKIEVGDSFVYGLLTGYDRDTNTFKIEGISENTGIPENARVTTTGLGDKFPSGLLIGTVKDVTLDNFELAKTVYVKPSLDFNDIHYVSVLKRGE